MAESEFVVKWEPSLEEIAEATRIIRQGWTEDDHRKRAGREPGLFRFPTVRRVTVLPGPSTSNGQAGEA